jgi:hypothetical protein
MRVLGEDMLYLPKVGTGFPGAEPKIRGYGLLALTARAIYYVPRQVFDLRRDASRPLTETYQVKELDVSEYQGSRFFEAVPEAFTRLGPAGIDGFLEKMTEEVATSIHVYLDEVRRMSVGWMLFRFQTADQQYGITLGLLSRKRGALRDFLTRRGLWKG